MRLVLAEFAPTYQYTAGTNLDRCAIFIAPLNKGAVTKADRTFSANFRDLMTRAPERTVTEADDTMVGSENLHRRWIIAMEGSEFPVGNEQPVCCTLLNHDCAIAVIGADAQEVSVAFAGWGWNEFVTDVVAETERVQNILPIGPAKNERFAVFGLPLIYAAVAVPPGIEMNILDASDVVDRIDPDSSP